MHSGTQQVAPPGSPERGGRPPTTGLYRDVIATEEDRALFDTARTMLGKLDEEIALARTNLARFQRSVEGSSKSGIPTAVSDGGRSITIRPYADIVQQHLELIGRLEERRSRMLAQANPTDAGHSGPVTWSFHPADEVALDVPHPAPGDPGGDDADAGE